MILSRKWKGNQQNGRKILVIHTSDKGLIIRIYKELLELKSERKNNTIKGRRTSQSVSQSVSRSVVSDALWPHESQHARPPCPSPTPGAYSNSCPLSRWCHPAISSSVVPFSSCPQSLPASGPFQWVNSAWGGQSIGVSASASVLSMNTQDWSPLG